MNTINNLTSSLIGNQFPEFISNEYPLFVDFISQYYQSLEKSGEPLDLINNLLTYLDVDFYSNNISSSCTLIPQNNEQQITETDTVISVDSTAGFPDTDGLIQINSEIILYKTKTETEFLSCSRGVSGVTNVDGEFKYSYSVSAKHNKNSKVINLSYLFILYFFSKIKKQYLPYFNQNFTSGLNVSTFIKNIKQFYNVKGTSKSFDFLIRSLFNVKNETLYPRERLLKPSDATFEKKTIILCRQIDSGNTSTPLELVGQKLTQEDITNDPTGSSIISGFVYIDSVQKKFTYNETLYELVVDDSVPPSNIIVPPKTRLMNSVITTDTVITVDSTVGFPQSGFIKIGNEVIKYTDKTINQFLNCTRGYTDQNTVSSYELSTPLQIASNLYGYSNVNPNNKIVLEILGLSNNTTINDYSNNYFEDDIISAKNLGFSDDSPLTKNWIFNVPKLVKISNVSVSNKTVFVFTSTNHDLTVGENVNIYGISNPIFNGFKTVSSVMGNNEFTYELNDIYPTPSITDAFVSKSYKFLDNNVPQDVINVYDENKKYLYVASSGVPSHPIGTGFTLGNQRFLKRIPRETVSSGVGSTITSGDIGIFLNGVLAQSHISNESIIYGEVTSIDIDNPGQDYGVGVLGGPSISISDSSGTTATASCVVDGKIQKIYVIDGGSGYVDKPSIEFVGSSGTGARAEAILNNGKIAEVIVVSSGSGYTSLPTINLIGGGGNGAILKPIVSGPISQINITNAGTGYTSNPNLRINLGNGAIAAPIINNGIIQSVALINGGTGYNSSPEIVVNDSTGNGTGAKIYANVSDGSITSFNIISGGIGYTEGFTTISVVPTGKNAIITPKVRTWTYNLYKTSTLDQNNAYVNYGRNIKYGYQYSYIANPKGLRYQKSDNITSELKEYPLPLTHSPIIGWAYDGNPIYGPYGHVDPMDLNSEIVRMKTGYSLVQARVNGPNITQYPIGTFIEDYSFTLNPNKLDENNGRYCVTPDFPTGVYAYFITIDQNGNPEFPYILGKKYYSNPDLWNFSPLSIQDNLPKNLLRYREPYQNLDIDYTRKLINTGLFNFLQEDGVSYIYQEDNASYIQLEPSLELYDYFPRINNQPQLSIKNVESGSYARIDNFYIESSGSNYKVGDRLIFDNENTGGYGASAVVSYISGVSISSSQIKNLTKIKYKDLNGIFSPSTNIIGLSTGSTGTVHYSDYLNNNVYVVGSGFTTGELISCNFNSVVTTDVSSNIATFIESSYVSTTLSSSVGQLDTNITVSSGTGISIGTNLLIDNEIVKVFSGSGNTFGVYRGQFNSISTGHSTSSQVFVLPNVVILNASLFDIGNYVKIDNEILRVVDSNNSNNTLTLLRSQIGSSLGSHSFSSTITKVKVTNAVIESISQTSVINLGTGSSCGLNQYDQIKISSDSSNDYYYIGNQSVLYTDASNIVYEPASIGSGISGHLSYVTNSKNTFGPIAKIKINSGGEYYKFLPKSYVSSDTGSGAVVVPQSFGLGKIKDIVIQNPGYDLNSDYTLKPELYFPKILHLNKTFVLDSIDVIDGGTGYEYIPKIKITGGGGYGAAAIATIKNGKVSEITVTNPGYGYSSTPTISVNKTYPLYINTFNSTLNFSINAVNTINTGDPVSLYVDGEYPLIYGGLQTSENTPFYAIVGGALDSNQIQLSLSYSGAISGKNVQFITTGTGNISLVSQSGGATIKPILKTKDFISGELVYQYDNSGNIIASGKVLQNNGWILSSKILRVEELSGKFVIDKFGIVGSKSTASGYIYNITSASGLINVDSYFKTNGEFKTETGTISNREQHILDSDYYQDYSYVLKNEIDFEKWNSSVKNIAHPSGFKLYGNKTIYSNALRVSSGQTSLAYASLQQNLFSDLNLNTYKNYAISQADYSTQLKDQVTVYNRLLTSFEQILTSKVDRIDDISNLVINYTGDGSTTNFYLNDRIKNIVEKNDISITVNDLPVPIQNWSLLYDLNSNYNIQAAKIVFNTAPAAGSKIIITCIGLNFDGVNNNFPLLINGLPKPYNNNQILITLNGIIQTTDSYDITQKTLIRFNEVPSLGSKINILSVDTGASYAYQIVGSGSSTYGIPYGASNDSSFVVIDGVVQSSDAYTISDTNIVFPEDVPSGSLIHIRSYGTGISSRQSIGIGNTSNIVPISLSISSPKYAIVSIDGYVQDPSKYTIGSGSTCIIFSEQINSGSNVFITNFDQHVNLWKSYVSDGAAAEYLLSANISTDDDCIITIDGVVQIPGTTNAYKAFPQNIKNINFTEPPKPRTKFFGLLYNRLDPSGNAVIDDFGKTYFKYNSISGDLVVSDYLQQKSNNSICSIVNIDTENQIIAVTGTGGTFGVGQTVISGLASSVSTGITTFVSTGSGITSGTNTFSVGSTSGFSSNDYILIDGEVMKIDSISSGTTSFVVTRGLVSTPVDYHPYNSLVTKIIPAEFTIASVYSGFNGTGITTGNTTFTLTTGGNPYNYNGTPFLLPSTQVDVYGQNYDQSLLANINGIVQEDGADGSFTLSGTSITFSEPPKEGTYFYGRYLGKLRKLNNISSKFNGVKTSFNLNIGDNIIYSLVSPDPSIDISNNVLVFLNGVLQNPGESFTVLGSRIIFSEAPKPNSSFLGYVYIGSDQDVIQSNVLSPIEVGDDILIDGEYYNRKVLSIDSSSSLSTFGYTGKIEGSDARILATVSSGKITSLEVINSGDQYNIPPILYFKGGGGYGAQAYATVLNGKIISATITNPGINYTSTPQIIIARNLSLSKTQRVRAEYELTYKKVTTLGSGLTFGSGTSLPLANQTVSLSNSSGLNSSGLIKIVDDSRPYPVVEVIGYTNISGNNLLGCTRGIGYNFNNIFKLDNNGYSFSSGQTITNGTGATATVINWDSNNYLLFVNKTSTSDFNIGDTISGIGVGISDPAFIRTYLSYGSGTTVIQVL